MRIHKKEQNPATLLPWGVQRCTSSCDSTQLKISGVFTQLLRPVWQPVTDVFFFFNATAAPHICMGGVVCARCTVLLHTVLVYCFLVLTILFIANNVKGLPLLQSKMSQLALSTQLSCFKIIHFKQWKSTEEIRQHRVTVWIFVCLVMRPSLALVSALELG